MMKHETKNKGGRPREHDRDHIANEMIEWAKLDSSINLNAFCFYLDPPITPSKITQWANEEDNFRQAYEITKAYLGNRREEMLSDGVLHVKAYDLNAKTYDHFLKQDYQEQQRFELKLKEEILRLEIKLKSVEQTQASESDIERYNMMMNQLKSIQDQSPARKAAKTISKTE